MKEKFLLCLLLASTLGLLAFSVSVSYSFLGSLTNDSDNAFYLVPPNNVLAYYEIYDEKEYGFYRIQSVKLQDDFYIRENLSETNGDIKEAGYGVLYWPPKRSGTRDIFWLGEAYAVKRDARIEGDSAYFTGEVEEVSYFYPLSQTVLTELDAANAYSPKPLSLSFELVPHGVSFDGLTIKQNIYDGTGHYVYNDPANKHVYCLPHFAKGVYNTGTTTETIYDAASYLLCIYDTATRRYRYQYDWVDGDKYFIPAELLSFELRTPQQMKNISTPAIGYRSLAHVTSGSILTLNFTANRSFRQMVPLDFDATHAKIGGGTLYKADTLTMDGASHPTNASVVNGVFTGTFEGGEMLNLHLNNHVGYGNDAYSPYQGTAVFSKAVKARIRNLVIREGSSIQSDTTRAAGIVGQAHSVVIENCVNHASITVDSNIHISSIGGIVGLDHYSRIEGCKNYGSIQGRSFLGGILGYGNTSTTTYIDTPGDAGIYHCVNYGAVSYHENNGSAAPRICIGGIVGRNVTLVDGCSNYGQVGRDTGYVVKPDSTINYVYNHIGGIVGQNAPGVTVDSGGVNWTDYRISDGIVIRCVNHANVYGHQNVGGIVGINENVFDPGGVYSGPITDVLQLSRVEKCLSDDNTVKGVTSVGGVAGANVGTVGACAAHEVTVTGKDNIGGIVGYNTVVQNNDDIGGSIRGVYYFANSETSLITAASGENTVGGIVGYEGSSYVNPNIPATIYRAVYLAVAPRSTGTAANDSYIRPILGEEMLASSIVDCYYLRSDSYNNLQTYLGAISGTVSATPLDTNGFASNDFIGDNGWMAAYWNSPETITTGDPNAYPYPYLDDVPRPTSWIERNNSPDPFRFPSDSASSEEDFSVTGDILTAKLPLTLTEEALSSWSGIRLVTSLDEGALEDRPLTEAELALLLEQGYLNVQYDLGPYAEGEHLFTATYYGMGEEEVLLQSLSHPFTLIRETQDPLALEEHEIAPFTPGEVPPDERSPPEEMDKNEPSDGMGGLSSSRPNHWT